MADGGAYAFVGDMLVIGESSRGVAGRRRRPAAARRRLRIATDFRATMDGLAGRPSRLRLRRPRRAGRCDRRRRTQLSALQHGRRGARRRARRPPPERQRAVRRRRGRAVRRARASRSAASRAASSTGCRRTPSPRSVVFGLRQTLEDAEAAIGADARGRGDRVSTLDTLRALAAFGLGIDLDADLLPLLDREVGIAITGFDGALPSGQLLLRPEDPDAAADALDRIGRCGSSTSGATRTHRGRDGDARSPSLSIPDIGEVAYAVVDGIVILGFGTDDVVAAIEAHAERRRRSATSDALRAHLRGRRAPEPAPRRTSTSAPLVELLGGAVELPDDARDILVQVGTLRLHRPVPRRSDRIPRGADRRRAVAPNSTSHQHHTEVRHPLAVASD